MSSELRKYVLTVKQKDEAALQKAGSAWAITAARNRLGYEIDWFGVPIIQTPEDIVLMQELMYELKPDVIVEIGIAHGGGAIFYASLLELLGRGKVIGVDIEIRKHNREVLEKHPFFKRIELLEGSSITTTMVEEVKKKIPAGATVLVCLDSNHTRDHVLKELQLYSPLVSSGSYIVVFDTMTSELAEAGAADSMYLNNGPLEAIHLFLQENDCFQIDKSYNKLVIGQANNGFLKRVK